MRKLITALLLTSSATTIYAAEPIVTTAAPTAISTPSIVEMQTNIGTITIKLNWEKAPITSQNFVDYINSGFYTNTFFHRFYTDFNPDHPIKIVQGGGYDISGNISHKKTNPAIINEAKNGLLNSAGTIAMARTNDINSATSEFFFNITDNPAFDNSYAVFGNVVAGTNVMNKVANPIFFYGNALKQDYSFLPLNNTNSLITIEGMYTSQEIDKVNSTTRVIVKGEGKVTSSPTGLICTATSTTKCTLTKKLKTPVKLTATTSNGYEFSGWTGDCKSVKTAITLNTNTRNNNCTATFAKIGS